MQAKTEWSELMGEKISRWGAGPMFAFLSIAYGVVMFAVDWYFYPLFRIDFLPDRIILLSGIFLIAIGVPFFMTSLITAMRAYDADKLVIKGIYSLCRHPLYSSWVIFIVPGIVLLMKSWIGMTTPIFMFLILNKLVEKEEGYLEYVYGTSYLEYKKRVPRIIPVRWKFNR